MTGPDLPSLSARCRCPSHVRAPAFRSACRSWDVRPKMKWRSRQSRSVNGRALCGTGLRGIERNDQHGQRVALRRGSEGPVIYLYRDHLGSTIAASGTVTESQRYWPYGSVRTGVISAALCRNSGRLRSPAAGSSTRAVPAGATPQIITIPALANRVNRVSCKQAENLHDSPLLQAIMPASVCANPQRRCSISLECRLRGSMMKNTTRRTA